MGVFELTCRLQGKNYSEGRCRVPSRSLKQVGPGIITQVTENLICGRSILVWVLREADTKMRLDV